MATFAYEVSPYRRKDGTYLVKIRMIHNREVVRKPTTIYVKREQLTRDLSKIKDSFVLDTVSRQLDNLRRTESMIEGSEFYSCRDLWDSIEARLMDENGFRLDFFGYARAKTTGMDGKTAYGYKSSFDAFGRFLGRWEIDINEVTYQMLYEFRCFLERENGKGCRAASYYLGCLRHIHNLARDEFNDEDVGLIRIKRQPFKKGLIPPQPATVHRTLGVDQMKALMETQPVTVRGRLAKDVFLLSFFLIGMNTVDLYCLEKKELKENVVTYNRRKTDSVRLDNALMKVRVEPEAIEIMKRNQGRSRLLGFADRYSTHMGFNAAVNIGLKEIGGLMGVDGLTTYHARHTWATLARNVCGIDFSTVHQALNHASRGSDRMTDIYVERDWSILWDANRSVLDLFV